MDAQSDVRKEFVDKELAINTLNSLLDTNTVCRDNTVKKLIVDCATNKRVRCGNTNQFTSCEYLFEATDNTLTPNGVVPYILNETLDVRNDFVFKGYVSYLDGKTEELTGLPDFGGADSKQVYFSNMNSGGNQPQCPRGQIPGIFPLPIATGTIFIELYICE